jgi:hypothetical protein
LNRFDEAIHDYDQQTTMIIQLLLWYRYAYKDTKLVFLQLRRRSCVFAGLHAACTEHKVPFATNGILCRSEC